MALHIKVVAKCKVFVGIILRKSFRIWFEICTFRFRFDMLFIRVEDEAASSSCSWPDICTKSVYEGINLDNSKLQWKVEV